MSRGRGGDEQGEGGDEQGEGKWLCVVVVEMGGRCRCMERIINSVECIQTLSKIFEKSVENRPAITKVM